MAMLEAIVGSGLVRTTHFDQECRLLADRHYSRRTPGAKQFAYSGRKLVLRNAAGSVLFVWMYPEPSMRMDGQTGYNCAMFRNESDRLSSEIILEAEAMAIAKWGPNRMYTYVDPSKIASRNPGYCFKRAGWQHVGESAGGKHLLVKDIARCRFCGNPAVGRYALDQGCVCYPDDREQDLCAQHVVRATPRGSMELLTTYTREAPR